MKINISSLGCRLNRYEIEAVATVLKERGHEITKEDADVYIINSCSVTIRSERKSRKYFNRALRELGVKNENGIVIITGCSVNEDKKDGNIFYLTNNLKAKIPQILEDPSLFEINTNISESFNRFEYKAPVKALRAVKANLKVQDGCERFCSYCIIPYMRGKSVSKDFKQTLSEAELLIEKGFKELVLTGVMIGNYYNEAKDLADLCEALLSLKGQYRLHLSSISPLSISDKLLDLLMHPKMVRHLHLSLQSGSNAILSSMNRGYTREQYIKIVEQVYKKDSLYNFSTDLIVGFPAESKEDFEQSLSLIKELSFSEVDAFRYSKRPKTKAALMPNQVEEKLKTDRNQIVMEISKQLKLKYLSQFHQKKTSLLVERSENNLSLGFNEYYIETQIQKELKAGEFYSVINDFSKENQYLTGKICK